MMPFDSPYGGQRVAMILLQTVMFYRKKLDKVPSMEALRLRMADLCARSEQCVYDVRRKLVSARLDATSIERIVNYLVDNSFIDEARYARAFVGDKVRFQGWGRIRIRRELALRRIPEACIAAALESIDEKEYSDAMRRVAGVKARSLDLDKREDCMRLFRFMAGKGYSCAEISALVKGMRSDSDR